LRLSALDLAERLGKVVFQSIHLRLGRAGANMALRFVARSIVCAAALAVCGLALPAHAQTPPPKKEDGFQTTAPYAILMDAETGTVLFERNSDKPNPPASMSKLMTTEVVLHAIAEGKLKYDDEMTISENAWRKGGAPSGGSAMFAALNSRVSVRDL
jgi:D-alanyl-D-alanine carboxypeptidase (penicillin-binding protein 5/6)